MRKKLILGLVLLNGLFAAALFAPAAETQMIPRGVVNCCKTAGAPIPYCCDSCCWFTWNCRSDKDCGVQTELDSSKF